MVNPPLRLANTPKIRNEAVVLIGTMAEAAQRTGTSRTPPEVSCVGMLWSYPEDDEDGHQFRASNTSVLLQHGRDHPAEGRLTYN